jgi:hypothetical protein
VSAATLAANSYNGWSCGVSAAPLGSAAIERIVPSSPQTSRRNFE